MPSEWRRNLHIEDVCATTLWMDDCLCGRLRGISHCVALLCSASQPLLFSSFFLFRLFSFIGCSTVPLLSVCIKLCVHRNWGASVVEAQDQCFSAAGSFCFFSSPACDGTREQTAVVIRTLWFSPGSQPQWNLLFKGQEGRCPRGGDGWKTPRSQTSWCWTVYTIITQYSRFQIQSCVREKRWKSCWKEKPVCAIQEESRVAEPLWWTHETLFATKQNLRGSHIYIYITKRSLKCV